MWGTDWQDKWELPQTECKGKKKQKNIPGFSVSKLPPTTHTLPVSKYRYSTLPQPNIWMLMKTSTSCPGATHGNFHALWEFMHLLSLGLRGVNDDTKQKCERKHVHKTPLSCRTFAPRMRNCIHFFSLSHNVPPHWMKTSPALHSESNVKKVYLRAMQSSSPKAVTSSPDSSLQARGKYFSRENTGRAVRWKPIYKQQTPCKLGDNRQSICTWCYSIATA